MAELQRDVQAVQIPDGSVVTLPAGTDVRVYMSQGGFYTVGVLDGKYRVNGKDGDAFGEKKLAPPVNPDDVEQTVEGLTSAGWKALQSVYDPEIPVDVVNLGLIHKYEVSPIEGDDGFSAIVHMGLTAPGCGMGDVMARDAEFALLQLPGIKKVHAEVVMFPVWNPEMMSEAARLKLGML